MNPQRHKRFAPPQLTRSHGNAVKTKPPIAGPAGSGYLARMNLPARPCRFVALLAGLLPLLPAHAAPPPDAVTPVAITVDAQAGRHPISPLIYGVAFASSNQLADLNFTLNRSGGNSEGCLQRVNASRALHPREICEVSLKC
jgi:hypothetical protein